MSYSQKTSPNAWISKLNSEFLVLRRLKKKWFSWESDFVITTVYHPKDFNFDASVCVRVCMCMCVKISVLKCWMSDKVEGETLISYFPMKKKDGKRNTCILRILCMSVSHMHMNNRHNRATQVTSCWSPCVFKIPKCTSNEYNALSCSSTRMSFLLLFLPSFQ